MATFGELQTRVSGRLLDPNHTAVPAPDVAASINTAIDYWKQRRFWFNESEYVSVLSVNNPVVNDWPSDFLYEIREGGFTIDYSNMRWPLTKINSRQYDVMNTQGLGLPRYITARDGQHEVYLYPDQPYDLVIRYVKDYPDLVGINDENDFTVFADQLIMYEALARMSAEFRQDDKMEAYYKLAADREYKSLKQRTNSVFSTGRLTVRQL
jgi:hypothetical protein